MTSLLFGLIAILDEKKFFDNVGTHLDPMAESST
jgi:hypothetical protein